MFPLPQNFQVPMPYKVFLSRIKDICQKQSGNYGPKMGK